MKSDYIIKSCFNDRYEKISIQGENYAIDEYYIIDKTYILTFYDINDCLGELDNIINNLYSDIITIQNQKLDDEFYKYEIYLILMCSKKEKINICDINEINKDKFVCRKIFIFGNEEEVIKEVNRIFNLPLYASENMSDFTEEEKIFINDSSFLLEEELNSIDEVYDHIYSLKKKSADLIKSMEENILKVKGIIDED